MTFARHVASCWDCGGAIQITQRQERLTLYRCTQCSMKGAAYDLLDQQRENGIEWALKQAAGDDCLIAETKRGR